MRLCAPKLSPAGFSASKGFQRNSFFCSNETTACVCSELCPFKNNNKIMEENHRKKCGQKGPLEVIQPLLYSEQGKTGLQRRLPWSWENTRSTTGRAAGPPSARLVGAAAAPAAPLWDTLPRPACPLLLESVFPAFRKINATSPF